METLAERAGYDELDTPKCRLCAGRHALKVWRVTDLVKIPSAGDLFLLLCYACTAHLLRLNLLVSLNHEGRV